MASRVKRGRADFGDQSAGLLGGEKSSPEQAARSAVETYGSIDVPSPQDVALEIKKNSHSAAEWL